MNSLSPSGGNKKVTAQDVATRAGVSKYIVSRTYTPGAYVSEKKRKKVIKAAEELGYRPNLLARSLSKKQSHIIAIVVDTFSNCYLLRILDEITRQLKHTGFSTMLFNIENEQDYQPTLLQADQFQVDGVIFLAATLPGQFVSFLNEIHHIPLIVLLRNSDFPGVRVVDTDNLRGGREVARLLIGEGYSRFGYMEGPKSESTRLNRLQGFEDELKRKGMELDCVLAAGNYDQERGYNSLCKYLDTTVEKIRIEALFCENDMLALGALDALHERKVDMAVVGYDGSPIGASSMYQLTSYRQPVELLAKEAVRGLIDKELPIGKFLAPGEIVLRESHKKKYS